MKEFDNKHILYKGIKCYIWYAKLPLMPNQTFWYKWVKIQNEERTSIMCNECGKFYKRLHTKHLKKHNLSSIEYKKKYWYSTTSSIVADIESLNISKRILWKPHSIENNKDALEKRRENHIKSLSEWASSWENSMERKNKFWTCPEQLKVRLKNYIERFWMMPTCSSIWQDWQALYSLLKHKYKNINSWFLEYWLPIKNLIPWVCVEYKFSDWEVIKIGYKYNNRDKLVKKIKETSLLFK